MNSMNRAQPKVVVVGAYNADLRVSCETPLVPGKSITGGPLQIFGGGRGANRLTKNSDRPLVVANQRRRSLGSLRALLEEL